ncbi:MAG: capsule assembly Wzi family protein [Gemmatimonadaceae bacterium]
MPIYSNPRRGNTTLIVCTAVALAAMLAIPLHRASGHSGQSIDGARGGISAGGELDNYLRYLETLGRVPLRPWSLRTFSAATVDSLTTVSDAHPWAQSWIFQRATGSRHFAVLPVTAAVRFNSAFPYGSNDGPIWAARGATTSLQGGVALAWGPLSAVLDPMVFRAENRAFTLQPNGQSGIGRFANGDFPTEVDRPQRYGDGAYSKFDLGESTVRLDMFGVSAGITTANQWWGPATVFPVILGNNAPGVPQFFLGTEHPTNIWIGRVQARVVYGVERQSDFSPVVGPDTFVNGDLSGRRRFMSGLVATFTPAPIPALELGAARYFHQAWFGSIGSRELRSPFEGILKSSIPQGVAVPGADTQDALKNQLASVFARWVLPHSGFEVYGEYGHEDHNYDLRDLAQEPDHSRIAMAGLRKVFEHGGGKFSAFRAEFIDATSPSLLRHRAEGLIYVHYPLKQGHTQDGQLLGADIGVGSPAGANLAWESYSPSGRTTWYVQRVVQNNQATFIYSGIETVGASHLFGTVGYERHRFGSVADITYGASLTEGKRGPSLPRETNIGASIAVTAHSW